MKGAHRVAQVAMLSAFVGCAAPPTVEPPRANPSATREAAPDSPELEPEAADIAPHQDPPIVLGESRRGDLRIVLESTKSTWVLGENIVVHYVVHNDGSVPTQVGFGSDYRGGARAARVKVSAKGPNGVTLLDPLIGDMNFGGLGGGFGLDPGESFAFTVPLHRYVQFETGGEHTFRVAHDLEVETTAAPMLADDPRWVDGAIQIVDPSPAEAKAVFAQMRALPSDHNKSVHERAGVYADFFAMRYPVYLPLLEAVAVAEPRALDALAGLATVDATRSVMRLAADDDVEVSRHALEVLVARIPLPPGQSSWRLAERDKFVAQTWDADALGPDMRTLALGLLESNKLEHVERGAALLAAVVQAQDLALVVDRLDAALEATVAAPIPYPEPRTPTSALLQTAAALLEAGAKPTPDPKRPGEIAVYLLQHGESTARPPDYATRVAGWLDHPIPQVRVLALRKTKLPLPTEMADKIPGLLRFEHLGVLNAACEALAHLPPNPTVHADLTAQMHTATDEWLVRCLNASAPAAGIDRDKVADIWATRLTDPGRTQLMYSQLLSLLDVGGGGQSGTPDAAEALRMQKRWRALIKSQRARIRRGYVFTSKDRAVSAELLPKGATVWARGGGPWLANSRP